MTVEYRDRLLLFSPHLDDAVFSVGAAVAAQTEKGREVIVCTVFAGDPLILSTVARSFHSECGLGDDAVTVRRSEDVKALARIGAQGLHLPFLDAIYRRANDGWLCESESSVYDSSHAEPQLLELITHQAIEVIRSVSASEVWTCGGIGGHRDHILTRDAVSGATAFLGHPLTQWADLPYAFGDPALGSVWSTATADTSQVHLERKIEAMSAYASQIRMLWPGEEDWRSLIFLKHRGLHSPFRRGELLRVQSLAGH